MKSKSCLFLLAAILMIPACRDAREILIEAEAFSDTGGWVTDQQAVDVLGSPYLLAHGYGRPVQDAVTVVDLEAGEYYAYVRTYNWTSPWHEGEGPGRFALIAAGDTLNASLGIRGDRWEWQEASSFRHGGGPCELRLADLGGLDGRCDAIYLSTVKRPVSKLPASPEAMHAFRLRCNPLYDTPVVRDSADFVVVGGGVSGMCAAVAAARRGLKVILVHDRPVLGGNNSAEVRVHLGGRIELDPYPQLGNLIKEFGHAQCANASPAECFEDDRKADFIAAEQGITLYAPYHAERSDVQDGKILRVYARNIATGELVCVSAPLFADCTGDGSLGFMSGADWTQGCEARSEFGEPMAPEVADRRQSGASVLWYSEDTGAACNFPEFNYGISLNEESVARVERSNWTWETGMGLDMMNDIEQIRDYALLAIYSNWSYLKNHPEEYPEFVDRQLEWVAYIAGKRESRRLLGDHILTENDLVTPVIYPDGTASASWSIDLHYPDPANSRFFPGAEFRSLAEHEYIQPYPIPFRCLYSRNIHNLMMAGRDVSATRIALGSVRVLRTCGMMGEVVGLAASVCRQNSILPSDVYPDHWDELDALMREGAGQQGLPNNQNFCIHGCYPPVK